MYSKSIVLLIFFSIISNEIFSQTPTFNSFFFESNSSTAEVTPLNLLKIGKYHLDKTWNAGNIYMKNGDSLVAYYMRYDLVRNHLEIIVDNKIKAINGSLIKYFEWFSVNRLKAEKFIGKDKFNFQESSEVSGFLELVNNGECKLLKSTRVFAPVEATSPSIINDTDQSIQILEELFIIIDNKAYEILGSKKKNLNFFNSPTLSTFVKEESLKFNNLNDLKKIVEFYNSSK